MKTILVATDGSENAKKSLYEARKIAEALGSSVDILTVVDNSFLYAHIEEKYYTLRQTDEELDKLGKELLAESLKIFDDFKGEIHVKLRTGDPADGIIKQTESKQYDLVIMGSRGLGTFSRAMLGSVSNKVLNHVKTNVLVVR